MTNLQSCSAKNRREHGVRRETNNLCDLCVLCGRIFISCGEARSVDIGPDEYCPVGQLGAMVGQTKTLALEAPELRLQPVRSLPGGTG